MILIGTSGFSYDDWKNHFYPPTTDKARFLEYYSGYFDTCEINSTYYSLPTFRMTEGLLRKSGGKVTFCIKANRRMTHEQDADRDFFRSFAEALKPLVAAEKLGAILAQFPQSLKPDERGKSVVEKIYEGFAGLPIVFEFRQARWAQETVFEWMQERDIGLCCVDEPRLGSLFPPIVKVTSKKIAYLRFHGRNAQKWYEHEQAYERYDYLYTEDELREWVPKILTMERKAEKVFVYYNNHFQAKAVENALQLKALLSSLPDR